ncbi:MAG: cytochrome b5 domain-containing protein [Micropruina sp.]
MIALTPLETGIFDTIAGLPLHPLVVHAAVVLLPLSALGLIALVLVPTWRSTFGWLTLGGLSVGTVSAFIAKESGEALAARLGLPAQHAAWGDLLVPVAVATLIAAGVWFWLQRGVARSLAVLATGIVASLLATASVVLTVLVGHSGAEAVWAAETTETTAQPTASAGSATYSLADVQAHATATDCWTAINGTVYNLTAWPSRHPGGEEAIATLCGIDGTQAYTAKHGSQSNPATALSEFVIGTISGPTTSTTPSTTASTSAAATSYTLAQVKQHDAASSCWSAIDGDVYDLTDWAASHPGGSDEILELCGTDGTEDFNEKHSADADAQKGLAGYKIGTLT